ncbi:sulfite exporter TauE/SafE family protein [Cytobacillus oceanisediminis]|uniref:sulfite exporter TauE/SafE family protein n=1 Tax=Cytobacillus oceanisediminis TaxID=665099 RepID=UPI00203FA9DC|nr:sulfite exporter TauE/SafE family protein [Cytobacillus oceanisediminis]MCM3392396.1 sulfite exporter TauE/SafE family protein [Cytobacillus oceanisediminis]
MEIFLFILIILIASILQTSTGFGFSILATPFLLLLFEPREAIQINLVLSLMISAALFSKIKKDTDFEVLKRFAVGSTAGLPIGIAIFLFLDISWLKLAVSFIILLLTILLMANFRVKETSPRDYSVAGLSGIMTASIGMPGPPLLLYFSGTDTQKERLRGTTLAFYLFIYSASLVFQIIFAGTNRTIWLSSLYALPLVLLGLYLGQILFVKINQRFFKVFTYIILIFTGIYLLVESVG